MTEPAGSGIPGSPSASTPQTGSRLRAVDPADTEPPPAAPPAPAASDSAHPARAARPDDLPRGSEDTDPGTALVDSLLELVACGVAVLDEHDRLARWNPTARSMLGFEDDDLIGHDAVGAALAPDRRPGAREILDHVRRTGFWKGSALLRRADGTSTLCSIRARAVPAGGRAAGSGGSGVLLVLTEPERRTPGGAPAGGSARLVEHERTALLQAERAARSELERARDRLAFVVHASSRLASSLDVGMTLETAGDLVVPRFGTLCLIDLWDGRRLDRVFVRDCLAGRPELAESLRARSGRHHPEDPAMRAISSGRPVTVGAYDPALSARAYDDPEARRIVERATAGMRLIAVPLTTRGRVIGVLTLLGPGEPTGGHAVEPSNGAAPRLEGAGTPEAEAGTTPDGTKHFEGSTADPPSAEDLAVLEQIANRAAQSIENARLFDVERRLARSLSESERRQRQAALTLQRSLLPAWTHQPEELEVATRYFPGAEEAEVGGDWYDVIPLAPGRTALVIGDVMGRGLRAATLMGQVRTAVRAYARMDLPPKQILELLDGVVADLGEAEIVTGVYAVFDALAGTLTYASAGHLPLLVVDRHGRCRRLDHETGLPLGVDSTAAPEHVVEVPPGTLVAFYTDGLVEHRRRDVDAGVDELVDALAAASGPLESIADRVIEALRPPGGYDDDVGLLLARARKPRESRGESGITVSVPHDLSAAAFARGRVAHALRQWNVDGERYDEILLCATELVTNALRHGTPPVQLQLRRLPSTLVVEVHDGSPLPPRPGQPDEDDYDGRRRGLQLVTMLSERWGWRRTQRGKTTWSEHQLPV